MCGIAGFIGKKYINRGQITRTLAAMSKRGPDYQNAVSYTFHDIHIELLHSRLSIIDLTARADQPYMIGNYVLIYNGEIYNYIELRERLINKNVNFETTSDTEVLLRFYIEYGEECVSHFEGMWAFAIYNLATGTIFISRDRFGEKPLYYYKSNYGIYFGSEVKFIKELSGDSLKVNHRQLKRYLGQGYKSLYKNKETFFENIFELSAGENCIIRNSGELIFKQYWKPKISVNESMTLPEAIEGSRDRLIKSMRVRLRADVPLAFCLSGGVDSASLVSIAAKVFNYQVESFSIIDSDERYNEKDNIIATVRDTCCKHTLIELSHDDSLNRLQRLIDYHDAPVATTTFFVHSMLSEQISKAGFKVAFSGTSADELFTGYYDHFLLHLREMHSHPDYITYLNEWYEHTGKFVRNPVLKNPELYIENPSFREHVFDNYIEFCSYLIGGFEEQFTEEIYTNNLLKNRMLNELFHEATPVILHEDDLNSMLYSIENRSPFLDTELFYFAYSIPSEHLIKNGFGKYVLREAMAGILNDHVRLDRRKKGFNASINSLFDLQDEKIRTYFLDPSAEIFQIVDYDAITRLFQLNPAPNEYSKFIFNFMNARIFLEQHSL
jgi:asparagine synthase (glutamine-hydrolysing)